MLAGDVRYKLARTLKDLCLAALVTSQKQLPFLRYNFKTKLLKNLAA